jgi:Cu-Zn family superoxide dismutase
MRNRILIAVPALLFAATFSAQPPQKTARADIYNAKGEKIGSATLQEDKGGVKIELNVAQLPPGTHALHIHAVGKCDAPDFKTAGPHFNPDGKKHGTKNPEGPHAGDLPNFEVGTDGHAKVSLIATYVTLGDGANSLFHPEGTALVIHEKPDDYMTDPVGNAGARIACGVVQK